MPLTPKKIFPKTTFHNCPVYYGEKVFGHGFFPQMLYPFKTRKLGNFLAHGRSHRRMGLVYFVLSSQCFIHAQNKHKLREIAFLFYRMPDSSIVFGCNNKCLRKLESFAQNTLFNDHSLECVRGRKKWIDFPISLFMLLSCVYGTLR